MILHPYYVRRLPSGGLQKQSVNELGELEVTTLHPAATGGGGFILKPMVKPGNPRIEKLARAMLNYCLEDLRIVKAPGISWFRGSDDPSLMGAYSVGGNSIRLSDGLSEWQVLKTVSHECFHAAVAQQGVLNEGAALRQEETAARAYSIGLQYSTKIYWPPWEHEPSIVRR